MSLLAALGCVPALSGCLGMHANYSESEKAEYKVMQIEQVIRENREGATIAPLTETPASEVTAEAPAILKASDELDHYAYRIGPSDILQISVPLLFSPATALTGIAPPPGSGTATGDLFAVADDGTISISFAGRVKVGGLNLREAHDRIVTALKPFMRSPEVLVNVAQFRSQKVLLAGQVATESGFLPITDIPLTLLGALLQSGGMAEERGATAPRIYQGSSSQQSAPEVPDFTKVTVRRGPEQFVIDAKSLLSSTDRARDPLLKNGDIVYVPPVTRGMAFVIGEVSRPSLMEVIPTRTSLAEVLSVAGISQQTANLEEVYVIRGDFKSPSIFQLNAERPDSLLLASQFAINENDVVYISASRVTRWNRVLNQILPSVQSLLSGVLLFDRLDAISN